MGETNRIYMNKKTGEFKGKCSPGFGIMTELIYDVDTKIVYYSNSKSMIMCPYISKNGKYCRLIDNKIVEV